MWDIFFNTSFLAIFVNAVAILLVASPLSLKTDTLLNKNPEIRDSLTLKGSVVLVFPLVASVSLLLYFYFFYVVALLSAISSCIMACYAVVYLCEPFLEFLISSRHKISLPVVGNVSVTDLILYPFSVIAILMWLATGHWFISNFLASALCTVFIGYIRVPNVKTLTYLMLAFFVYDIFWVFGSTYFFGKNVMETVASQKAENPVNIISHTLRLPSWGPAEIHIPAKLMWGDHMLGLGDISLPGILISYIYRHEYYSGRSDLRSMKIFQGVMAGYSVGLFVTYIFLTVFRVAQPALLYLVPFTLFPVFVMGSIQKELHVIWHGTKYSNINIYPNLESDDEEITDTSKKREV